METLAHGYGLAEAPVWVPPEHDLADGTAGALVFSDVLGGGVHRWSPASGVTTVIPKRRGVGGLALHADGGLVATGRDLQHVRNGEIRTLLTLDGVTGFNDMTTDAEGRVYVGALRFNPFAGDQPVPGEVWRLTGANEAEMLFDGIDWPNGIGFSPDGGTIYACDYAAGKVIAHDLDASGEAGNRRVFAESPSGSADGLAVDSDGGVWVALGAGGVGRFTADGSIDETIEVPAAFVASLCFGGADGRDLFVTTADLTDPSARRGAVLETRVDVAGLPVAPAAV